MTSPLAPAAAGAASPSLPSNANTSLFRASAPEMALALDSAPHLQSESDATNATTKPTNNPITDFMQDSDGTANAKHTPKNLPTPPATTATTTKIPHPQSNHQPAPPYPLSALVQAKNAQQFRRSASLRLRGTKSNLLFNDSGAEHDATDMDMEHANNVNTTRIGQNDNAPAITKFAAAPPAKESQRVASESSSVAGRFSTRRKVVLHSQAAATGLTRSLSLRRQQHLCYPGCKTDSPKETCRAGGVGAAPADAPADVSAQREQATAAAVATGNCVTTNGQPASDNGAELKKCTKDLQKMSLNLNGAPSTATPAGNGSGSFKSKATTPKTPTTTTAHEHYHQHQHQQSTFNHHSHATRFIKSSPTTAAPPDTKLTPKTPPVTPDSPCTYLDDDLDSMYSFATTTSGRSTMSCEHPYVARNGTTFSGRKMKYVVHCSNYAGQVGPDYLTPTQRATRQIRRLKELLSLARQDLEQKDSEILRLTREVVELRLFKASLSSPEERSNSSDAVTVREAELKTSQDVSPIVDMVDDATKSSPRHIAHAGQHHQLHHSQQLSSEMQSSFADSGHFEDLTTSSVHSKDSYAAHTHDMACGSDMAASGASGADAAAAGDADAEHFKSYELQRQELIRMYELKIEELIRTQDASASEMKRSHNDKVEALLQKLAECNTRYADIVPDYEHAKERIRELEKQLEDLQRKLAEHEEKQNKMYLHMYQKGQEAERIARADQALELAHRAPSNKVSINELLHQLQSTQDELENIRTIYRRLLEAQKNRTHVDPEVTLQFLKSAIYYFLTDKENSQGHLQAIESILEFTEAEKQNINRARTPK